MLAGNIVQDPRFNFIYCYVDSLPAEANITINQSQSPKTSLRYSSSTNWNPSVQSPYQGLIGFSYDPNSFVYGDTFTVTSNTGNMPVSAYASATSSLLLYLDASFQQSYPGTGATWSDLSGNNNNCTLVNSPTYNSSNGGSIVFNGSTQYGSVANSASLNGTTQTISVWYNTTNNLLGRGSLVIGKTDTTNSLNGYNLFANSSAQVKNATQTTDITGGTVTNSTWVNVTMTFTSGVSSSIYVNGSLAATTGIISFTISSQPLRIGISQDTFWTAFAGNIASVAIYNRALSQDEIAQNFDALKSRYGL